MQGLPAEDESRHRTGEHRQLTVMFCDVVDSGRLLTELGAEVWKEVKKEYARRCRNIVEGLDGELASQQGDGLLFYFGLPAHEDDARRAVRAGLAMIEAVQDLGLHVRVAIDTGRVVIDAVVDGRRAEDFTGGALDAAARLQTLAEPDTVVVSGSTFALVRGYFDCEDRGSHQLKNVPYPVHVYRVIGTSGAADRTDVTEAHGPTPFIGRDLELQTLVELWERVRRGQSCVAEISGEPGIGKSRLVKAISEQVDNRIVVRCSPINANTALYPVTRSLERLLQFDRLEGPSGRLQRLEERLTGLGFSLDDIGLLASELALPLPERFAASNLSAQQKRAQTLNLLVEWHLREARRRPVMAVWEDLHWADPTTIELLGLIIERAAGTPLMTVMTFRPDEFQPPWTAPASLTELPLKRLDASTVEHMLSRLTTGRSLPREVVDQIVEKTDGVPLLVEELLQAVLDSGFVRLERDRYVLASSSSPITIPATLQGWLMSRLDRLGSAKAVAQRAAVLGRTFAQHLIRAVLEAEAQHEHERADAWRRGEEALNQLVLAGVLHERKARQTTYEFKHALVQKAAYESLLYRDSRDYHVQTAAVIEARFPQMAERQPEVLAHHYAEAFEAGKALEFPKRGTDGARGRSGPAAALVQSYGERAVEYLQRAGERARDRSANKEAVHHFARARRILADLPEGEARDRRELTILVDSLTPLIAVDGYVATTTAQTVNRALELGRALGEQLGGVEGLFSVLYVQWVTRLVRGEYTEALRLSEDFLRESTNQGDSAPLLTGHRLRGFSLFAAGEGDLAEGRRHLQESLRLYDPHRHAELKNQGYGQDPRCACEAFLALVEWLRGGPETAAGWSRAALEHANESHHSNTQGYALCFGGVVWDAMREDVAAAAQRAAGLVAFSEAEGLPVWLSYGRVVHGWAAAHSGQIAEGIAEMELGLADFDFPSRDEATAVLGRPPQGMGFMKSFLLYLLAVAYARDGRIGDARSALDTAWSIADGAREGFWKAEVKRLAGELMVRASESAAADMYQQAEDAFLAARGIASAQGALALELRATMSLCRLWQDHKPEEGRRMLADVYGRFTEGWETPDLIEARRLLDKLTAAA